MASTDLLGMALAALSMGLLGSPHCVGMCGGIAGALSPAMPGDEGRGAGVSAAGLAAHLLLSVGRIGTYALLGALAGSIGWVLGGLLGPSGTLAMRLAFGALMVLVGLSVAGWLAGLGWIEAGGARVWARLSPALGAVLPADRSWKQLAAGAVWGWLPCGLVYAALAGAATTGSGVRGALLMLCFGLGTLPAVVGTGVLAGGVADFARRLSTRRVVGAMLIVFGIWTGCGPLLMRAAHQHSDAAPMDADAPAEDHQHHH